MALPAHGLLNLISNSPEAGQRGPEWFLRTISGNLSVNAGRPVDLPFGWTGEIVAVFSDDPFDEGYETFVVKVRGQYFAFDTRYITSRNIKVYDWNDVSITEVEPDGDGDYCEVSDTLHFL